MQEHTTSSSSSPPPSDASDALLHAPLLPSSSSNSELALSLLQPRTTLGPGPAVCWINDKLSPELFRRVMERICSCEFKAGDHQVGWYTKKHVDCYPAWAAASSVCRSWRADAQVSLFEEVYIETHSRLGRFADSPALGKVKTDGLALVYSNDPGPFADKALQKVFDGCDELTSLHMAGFREAMGALNDEFFLRPRLSALKSLSLHKTTIISRRDFTFLPFFNLEKLQLLSVTGWNPNIGARGEYTRLHSFFRFQTISHCSILMDVAKLEDSFIPFLKSIADSAIYLQLQIWDPPPNLVINTLSLFHHLTELELCCDSSQLVTITEILPSKLVSLSLLSPFGNQVLLSELLFTLFSVESSKLFGGLSALKLSRVMRERIFAVKEGMDFVGLMQKKKILLYLAVKV